MFDHLNVCNVCNLCDDVRNIVKREVMCQTVYGNAKFGTKPLNLNMFIGV